MAAAVAPPPADRHVPPPTVALYRDDALFDQQADDALPVRRRRARRPPQCRQVPRQGPNLLTLRCRQPGRLAATETRVLLLQPPLLLQRLLPAPLQFSDHQPVLRLDGVVLPPRALHLVTGSLPFLLPHPMEPRALLVQVVRGGQA